MTTVAVLAVALAPTAFGLLVPLTYDNDLDDHPQTLVAHHGAAVLLPLGIPLIVLAVWLLLYRRHRRRARG